MQLKEFSFTLPAKIMQTAHIHVQAANSNVFVTGKVFPCSSVQIVEGSKKKMPIVFPSEKHGEAAATRRDRGTQMRLFAHFYFYTTDLWKQGSFGCALQS